MSLWAYRAGQVSPAIINLVQHQRHVAFIEFLAIVELIVSRFQPSPLAADEQVVDLFILCRPQKFEVGRA